MVCTPQIVDFVVNDLMVCWKFRIKLLVDDGFAFFSGFVFFRVKLELCRGRDSAEAGTCSKPPGPALFKIYHLRYVMLSKKSSGMFFPDTGFMGILIGLVLVTGDPTDEPDEHGRKMRAFLDLQHVSLTDVLIGVIWALILAPNFWGL